MNLSGSGRFEHQTPQGDDRFFGARRQFARICKPHVPRIQKKRWRAAARLSLLRSRQVSVLLLPLGTSSTLGLPIGPRLRQSAYDYQPCALLIKPIDPVLKLVVNSSRSWASALPAAWFLIIRVLCSRQPSPSPISHFLPPRAIASRSHPMHFART